MRRGIARSEFSRAANPVLAYPNARERSLGHTLYAQAEGEVVSASFRSLWCGVPISDRDPGKDELGSTAKASIHLATYALADQVAAGRLELFPCCVAFDHEGERHEWNASEERYVPTPHTYTFYRYEPALASLDAVAPVVAS